MLTGGVALVVLAATGLLCIRRCVLVAVVRGPSMLPTYDDGDRLIARRRRSAVPRPGEVIVFRNPHPFGVPGSSQGPLLIKRVAAVPGEAAPPGMSPNVVPDGHVAVLGDNSDQSLDSRQLGFIPLRNVVAVVVRKLNG
jgi:signal peptidase I